MKKETPIDPDIIEKVKELREKNISFNKIGKQLGIKEYTAIKATLTPEEWEIRYGNKKQAEKRRLKRDKEKGLCVCCGVRYIAPGNQKLCTVCYKDNSDENSSIGFISHRRGHAL